MSVQEIEMAIERLETDELAELASWFEHYHSDVWDRQIQRDFRAGRLDNMIRQANEDFEAGRWVKLP